MGRYSIKFSTSFVKGGLFYGNQINKTRHFFLSLNSKFIKQINTNPSKMLQAIYDLIS